MHWFALVEHPIRTISLTDEICCLFNRLNQLKTSNKLQLVPTVCKTRAKDSHCREECLDLYFARHIRPTILSFIHLICHSVNKCTSGVPQTSSLQYTKGMSPCPWSTALQVRTLESCDKNNSRFILSEWKSERWSALDHSERHPRGCCSIFTAVINASLLTRDVFPYKHFRSVNSPPNDSRLPPC